MHLSLFEESYCYALTNSINSGIPILYLNRGAFTERLQQNSIINSSIGHGSININKTNNKYFPCDIQSSDRVGLSKSESDEGVQETNITKVLNDLFEYIVTNQDVYKYYKLNSNLQPNKWYMENYT